MTLTNAEQVVQALKPMLVATNMRKEKSPTISVIAPLHAQLLNDTTSTIEDSSVVREIKTTIHHDLSKQYDILHISSALNESQVSPLPSDNSTEQQTPETTAHTPKNRKSALADLLGQMFKTTHHWLSANSIAETVVKQYLDAPPVPLTDDPLHWSKAYAQAYPLLAKLAQRHLCVPGTSVPVSTAGDIISSQRSCLTSEHADLKKNVQL